MVTIYAAPQGKPADPGRRHGPPSDSNDDANTNARGASDPAPNARTPLYVRHQTASDLSAWSVTRDIGWDRVRLRPATTSPATLDSLRDACLTEAVQLVAVARLAGVVAEDMDGSVAASIVAGEGAKHFHALRLYLDAVGHHPTLTDRDVERGRVEALAEKVPADPVDCVVGLLLSEHLASGHYRTLAGRATEPVLRDLLRLIAADKVRHARMAADILERWVEKDSSLASRLRQAAAAIHELGLGQRTSTQSGRSSGHHAAGSHAFGPHAFGHHPSGHHAYGHHAYGHHPAEHHASVRTLANRLERISTTALRHHRSALATGSLSA